MSCTAELLTGVSRNVESEVRSRLNGFLGGIFRAYLPQTWVFRTEEGAVSLVVGRDGGVSVVPAAAPEPDVTVEAAHDELKAVLSRSGRPQAPPRSLKVTPHTAKGRTAFDYLRGRFGL
jgi:hypothetical protein